MDPEAYALMHSLEERHWWFLARRDIVVQVVRRYTPAGGRILDYGAGTAFIAKGLRDGGYEVVVADVDEHALRACRAAEFPTIDLRTEAPPTSWADSVLLADALEHANREKDVLEAAIRSLSPRGHVIVTVPAFEFLWSGEDYMSHHRRRYTAARLREALEDAGLRVCWCQYFNTALFPLIATAILWKRLFRPRDMYRSNIRPVHPLLNRVLYRIFAAESRLVGRLGFPIGASLLAVAGRATGSVESGAGGTAA